MRKETIFAIFAGTLIGLIFAFGAWKVTRVFKKNTPQNNTAIKNSTKKQELGLTVTNLKNFDVVVDDPFKIIGIGGARSTIIVSTIEKDFSTQASEDGSFEIEVEIPAGISEVKINDQKFIVAYSSEFKKYLSEGSNPKTTSYVGTITDISEGTLQIKGGNGEILQASNEEDTTYVNTVKKVTEVKETDLAIGDYVVVLGFINGNKVLHGKRVIITTPLEENKIEAVNGKVELVDKKNLTLTKTDDTNLEITLPKTWNGPDTSDLEVGQDIIVTGKTTEDKFDLRSIIAI